MKTLQLKINTLEEIIRTAKERQKHDSSLSDTIQFNLELSSPTHLGNDGCNVELKSGYSECVNTSIYRVLFTD